MSWRDQLNADPLPWLLEPDTPSVRHLAMRDLLDLPSGDSELREARVAAHKEGAIPAILAHMDGVGYWEKPGPGYGPKYRSTVWSVITLAQLGGSASMDERIAKACEYVVTHALTEAGQFTATGAPSGTADCLQGNLCAGLIDLGYEPARLEAAFDWMARTVTGEGIAPAADRRAPVRYYAGNCGPLFACGANNKLSCAWGGAKVMLALGKLPANYRTPVIENAIDKGIEFLFSTDPADADYPSGWNEKPSRNWWKFGFPVFYITDLLQIVEGLVALGYGADPRLQQAIDLILAKQDEKGRWPLEYSYAGKIWFDFGEKKQPNKWVTLRALRVLKEVL